MATIGDLYAKKNTENIDNYDQNINQYKNYNNIQQGDYDHNNINNMQQNMNQYNIPNNMQQNVNQYKNPNDMQQINHDVYSNSQYTNNNSDDDLDDILRDINNDNKNNNKKKNNKNKIDNNNKKDKKYDIIYLLKELLIHVSVYLLLSTGPLKKIFMNNIVHLKKSPDGKISILGIIIYGTIMGVIFILSRTYILGIRK